MKKIRASVLASLIIVFASSIILSKDMGIITICGEEVGWDGSHIIEPESDLPIQSMSFSDFGDGLFVDQYAVSVDSYILEEGKITQTQVVHIHSSNPGKTVYVVGGIHGDERAGWYAGLLLGSATISSGDLYVLAPANSTGARNLSRYVSGTQDLNRNFPGSADGNDVQQLAYAIFSDIKRADPDIVLDLHEAIIYSPAKRDFLGSTFIFTELDGIEDLFFDMLFSTQDGTLCHNEFGYNGPGPAGSINRTVSDALGIPTITVETFRGFDIRRRVCDQLEVVQFVLQYYGMR